MAVGAAVAGAMAVGAVVAGAMAVGAAVAGTAVGAEVAGAAVGSPPPQAAATTEVTMTAIISRNRRDPIRLMDILPLPQPNQSLQPNEEGPSGANATLRAAACQWRAHLPQPLYSARS